MKNTATLFTYLITFFGMYFILSAFGMVFGNQYNECLNSSHWFFMYTIFIGWWLAMIPASDVYQSIDKGV